MERWILKKNMINLHNTKYLLVLSKKLTSIVWQYHFQSIIFMHNYSFLFIWKTEKLGREHQVRNGGERDICHSWFIFWIPAATGVWARLKPGIKNPLRISHLSGRNSSTWIIICCLQGALAGSWIWRQRQDSIPGALIRHVSLTSHLQLLCHSICFQAYLLIPFTDFFLRTLISSMNIFSKNVFDT